MPAVHVAVCTIGQAVSDGVLTVEPPSVVKYVERVVAAVVYVPGLHVVQTRSAVFVEMPE